MRNARWWVTVAVVLCGVAAPAQTAYVDGEVTPRHRLLRPDEIIKRLDASPVEYKVSGMETLDVARGRLADELYPELVHPVDQPRVVRGKDGKPEVVDWPEPPAAKQPMAEAEEAFKKKDYAAAAAGYRKAIAAAPDYYVAHIYLGDALLFGGDEKGALKAYDKAVSLNPNDYHGYFFRATADRHLGKLDAMVDDLRAALTLKPRHANILKMMEEHGDIFGVKAEPEVFVPRAFVRREGDKVAVYADAQRPEWLAWAMCKALWRGEASHRKEMTGSEVDGWSTTEETECLASLVSVYADRRARGEGDADPRLDRLMQIGKDGLASAFVVYELGSRVEPQLVLRLDPKGRALVRKYIDKYVLIRTSAAKKGKPRRPH